MPMNRPSPRVALLTNIIAPYRVPVYAGIANESDLLVLHGGTEANRGSWRGVDSAVPAARAKRSWGFQMRLRKRDGGKFFDHRFVHVTPGFFFDLIREHPDAVITNEMGFRTIMALLYGALFHRPVWVWWGGTIHTERGIGGGRKALRRLISRWAKQWISYGQTSTEYLCSLGIPRGRILQIQNCVEEGLYTTPGEPVLRIAPRPVILCVGRLVPQKGLEHLLEAAARLQNEGLQFSLVLVGDGPEKADLERLARGLGLANLYFEPARAPEQMPGVYRSADVLVFPTLGDVWGLVVNEALLSGLPVLCSCYAGCSTELVPMGNVFNPEDPIDFVAGLKSAVLGQLAPPDLMRLKTCSQVTQMILGQIKAVVTRTPIAGSVEASGPLVPPPRKESH